MADLQWMERKSGKCAVCKEKFNKPSGDDWGYSYRGKECCSYHCMRALERKDKNSWLHIKEAEEESKKNQTQIPKSIPVSRKDNWTRMSDQEKSKILELYISGKTIKDVAEELGRSRHAVSNVLRDFNARDYTRRRGAVTDQQHNQIQQWHKEGKPIGWIARRTGYSETTVRNHIFKIK